MLAFTLRRAIQAIGVMIAVGIISFSMFRYAGDPVNQMVGVETSVAELAGMIIEMTGSRSKITRRPLPVDDPVQRCPDIAEAERVLSWHPKTALKDGLARTIDYFDKLLGSNPGRRHEVSP